MPSTKGGEGSVSVCERPRDIGIDERDCSKRNFILVLEPALPGQQAGEHHSQKADTVHGESVWPISDTA
jgi:hypothetical protein